jgi:hypothetical protein
MKFAISMTDIEGEWESLPETRRQEILELHGEFKRALSAAGKFVEALHFHPRSEAKTVRMDRNGSSWVGDGPFSDAQEFIGGIYVIEADSIDEAVEWARKGRFLVGANEVRQIW